MNKKCDKTQYNKLLTEKQINYFGSKAKVKNITICQKMVLAPSNNKSKRKR